MQVSAHYPPDFVSGGALVPQRIAEGLADRGYQSYVFAGKVNELVPAQTQDEEINQVHVRWVGNANALGWVDRENYDNPAIASKFVDYLAEVKPEIVHFHSVQSLGAQLLPIARNSGAYVVVTMHDFWWICERQFLADRNYHPCSPVISGGDCACETGRNSLLWRNRWLAQQLTAADLVLFPSETARQVLIANGLDPQKTAVNENGVDDVAALAPSARTTANENTAMRFMYAGGEDLMKGYAVLRAACQQAQVPPGTTLDLYHAAADGFPEWVHSRPRYRRDELTEIFAQHDILILPSLMKESQSILTREALKAGLAVIATDSFGPEEVVTDGINGRIIRTGDIAALAQAISECAIPENGSALTGQSSTFPLVTVTSQIDDVIGHYQEVIAAVPEDEASTQTLELGVETVINRVLFVIGIQGAPARYRAHLPAEALRLRGVKTKIVNYRDPKLLALARRADAVVFYRVPATAQVLGIIERIKAEERVIPILGDVDDLIFVPEIVDSLDNLTRLSDAERELWLRGVQRYRTILEACDYFIGSTSVITEMGHQLLGVPATGYPNGVGSLLAQISQRARARQRTAGPIRIGYFSGTDTHDADWTAVEDAVAQVMASHPVELWLGGHVEYGERLRPYADRIKRLPFVPWYQLPELLREVDICLAPLTDTIFNEAKSAIKWLESALVSTPTVASDTGPFRAAIVDGETGFLASTTAEWQAKITQLVLEPQLRYRMGRQALRAAMFHYSPEMQGRRYQSILQAAWLQVARSGHKVTSEFIPVYDDQSQVRYAAVVERYGLPRGKLVETSAQLGELLRRGGSAVRREGVGATMRQGWAFLRRCLG